MATAPMTPDLEGGLQEVAVRLARLGVPIQKQLRSWPTRSITYIQIGRDNRLTDFVLSDSFVRKLKETLEYREALDTYGTGVAKRVRCGSPELFYCESQIPVRIEFIWPVEAAVIKSELRPWLRANVTHLITNEVAWCCVPFSNALAFLPTGDSELSNLSKSVNRVRNAIDDGEVRFYEVNAHPTVLQQVPVQNRASRVEASEERILRFIVGKTYWLAFKAVDLPGEAWVADIWDAEYLGVAPRALAQAAYIARAKGLLTLDPSMLEFARPADKLVTDGFPAALETDAKKKIPQFKPSALPTRDSLLKELAKTLTNRSVVALILLDLDNFKQVNDTKGHPEGDKCLETAVGLVEEGIVGKGNLYRWGSGDEFAVLLPNFTLAEAAVTAERVRKAIEEGKPGGDIAVTASIGVCATDVTKFTSADEMAKAADDAMYVSKKNGKNRVSAWPVP